MPKSVSKPFAKVLADLANEKYPPALDDLATLVDLSGEQLDAFQTVWKEIAQRRRLDIMIALSELSDEDFKVNINAVSRIALKDPDANVRAQAIRNLDEDDRTDLIPIFIKFLTGDSSSEVREAAATALGIFVYLGEMEEVSETLATTVEDALINVFNGTDELNVRRRALEAVSYKGRREVNEAIEVAYRDKDDLFKISAVFAMGRSLDNQWSTIVLRELKNISPRLRFEAARASGELQLREAVEILIELTRDVDNEVQEMTIWALGEIGGEDAREALAKLLKKAKGERVELIEDAIANAEIIDDLANFDALLNLDDLDNELKRRLN